MRQKLRLRPKLSPKFLSTLGPNATRKARPDLQLCLNGPRPFGLSPKLVMYNCVLGKTTLLFPTKANRHIGLFWKKTRKEKPKSAFCYWCD